MLQPSSSLLNMVEKQNFKASSNFDILLSKIFLFNTSVYL
jgi:hypothetical protein